MKKYELYIGGEKLADVLDDQHEITSKQSAKWVEPKNLTHEDRRKP